MKRPYFLALSVLFTIQSFATVIHVDNKSTRPSGYYENLQLAINNASIGDSLYLYPSNQSYGTVYVTKKLHLFGKGFDGTTGNVSRIEYLYLDTSTSPATNSSGSSIQGLTINMLLTNKPNINNIVVSGNYFYSSYNTLSIQNNNCSGWLIINNYFNGYIEISNNYNILITNNIFRGNSNYPFANSSSNSVIFSHNLVHNFHFLYYVSNAIISDNIFLCTDATNSNYMSKNTFYNNLSWQSTLNPYLLPPTANSGSNNISNQDPKFETALSSGNFDQTKDYHLKSTSPGKNAASDGSDIGPYGGNHPFEWGGVFGIPNVTESLITNPVINQVTPINVNVKAKKAGL